MSKLRAAVQAPTLNIPRSTFDLSHGHTTAHDVDVVVPLALQEILPADTFKVKSTVFARVATPVYPLMDTLFYSQFAFFVPNRLVWDNWKKFMGERVDPDDSIDYTVPTATNTLSWSNNGGTLHDYFGLPLNNNNVTYSVLPFRGYWQIYTDWFRDANLQDSMVIARDDTSSITTQTPLNNFLPFKRGKRADYFTTCLPSPQRGQSVELPLGTQAPVATDAALNANLGVYSTTQSNTLSMDSNLSTVDLSITPASSSDALYADLSGATAATINQLRQAFQIQSLLEIDNRGGTRYISQLFSHFGVKNAGGDARLQRPEFLGSSMEMVTITPIAQTSSTDATSPQGNLSAMGTVLSKLGFTRSFTEHGYLFILGNCHAQLSYQQGLQRHWFRQTRYDFYYPVLSNIGEQSILKKELYHTGTATDDETFGYQERHAEYRTAFSLKTNRMRSIAASASLDAWHLSEDFSSQPSLNASFIESNTPMDRVVAVPSEPDLLVDAYFDIKATRPMPLNGIPYVMGMKF